MIKQDFTPSKILNYITNNNDIKGIETRFDIIKNKNIKNLIGMFLCELHQPKGWCF